MNNKQLEFMAYKTAMSICTEQVNTICSFSDMIDYINNTQYLHDVLSELLNDRKEVKINWHQQRITMILNKLLATEDGVNQLLSSMLNNFTHTELKHVIEHIINNYQDKVAELCFKFAVRTNYIDLDLSKEHIELIESFVTAYKIIYGV